MVAPKKAVNPFYVLLVVVGVLFLITACAYGVMTVRHLRVEDLADESPSSRRFLRFLDEHGVTLLMTEIAALALATVAAIGTDEFWSRTTEGDRRASDQERSEMPNRHNH